MSERTPVVAMVIPADATKPVQIVSVATAKLAAAIGAQWFELVRHPWLHSRGLVMVVDEEGLLNGAPPNPRATRALYPHGLGICGDALLCAEAMTDDGLDIIGLSPFQVGMLAGLEVLDAVAAHV